MCGLVERRIRGELRRRALDANFHALAPLPAEPPRSSELAFILLAGLGALGSTLAVAAAWGVGPALWTALGLAVMLVSVWAVSPRSSKLASWAARRSPSRPARAPTPPPTGEAPSGGSLGPMVRALRRQHASRRTNLPSEAFPM
ncbi:hypothetical protein [Nannocystis pusilla]|uniref:hypothetical protein n=1 Tax=Nannocystis pusilla TaxID=889268 RepID=UPI003DA61222